MRFKTMYISGAITGNPTYKEDFAEATEKYRKIGFTVCNPVEIDEDTPVPKDADWWWYLRRDMDIIWKEKFEVILVLDKTLKHVDKAFGTILEVTMGEKYGAEIWHEKEV